MNIFKIPVEGLKDLEETSPNWMARLSPFQRRRVFFDLRWKHDRRATELMQELMEMRKKQKERSK